ncbi:anaerobic ribonucleoside-triphosphate reductase activating protein [Sphaerochaeta sp.]|uniref:anaerobic ribonucleoside-triphosphate reductase activating protein n=1 Tax=Sphaerochaeta sp. TaxID=1972642 RepID=UPI003D0D093D
MNISAIEANSFLDYPGKLSCVVFLQGCNYDCFYCHNRRLIERVNGALGYQEVVDFLKSRQGFLQAVVISGGEPTLNQDLGLLIRQAKALGYLVKLDTNGSRPHMLSSLLGEGGIDYVALDVKAPWERYREIGGAGADPKSVQESLSLLASWKEARKEFQLEVRTTLAPTLTFADLRQIATDLVQSASWTINAYRVPPSYREEDVGRIHLPPTVLGEVEEGILRSMHPALMLRR